MAHKRQNKRKSPKRNKMNDVQGQGTQSHKMDSYIIPIDVQKEMERMIKETHKVGKEMGMSLCAEKGSNIIRAGNYSTGDEVSIQIPENCRHKGEIYVGAFHTHPSQSEAAASAQDLHSSCLRMSNFDCIGKNKRGEIVCYAKKSKNTQCTDLTKPLKMIEDEFERIPDWERERIRKPLYDEVDRLAADKFTIHRIEKSNDKWKKSNKRFINI